MANLPTSNQPSNPMISSGEDIFKLITKDQQKKAINVLEKIATHNIDKMTKGMDLSTEEAMDKYNKLYEEFLDSINKKMQTDVGEFRYVLESYIKDLKEEKVDKARSGLTETELKEWGLIGVKGDILKSAPKILGSGIRHAAGQQGFSRKDLGTLGTIQNISKPSNGTFSNVLDVFKDKSKQDTTVDFDKKRFSEDAKYRKDLLSYAKDLKEELRKGNKLSTDDNKLLKKLAEQKQREKVLSDPAVYMPPLTGLMFNMGKSIVSGLGNAFKNIKNKIGEDRATQTTSAVDTPTIPKVQTTKPYTNPIASYTDVGFGHEAANDSSELRKIEGGANEKSSYEYIIPASAANEEPQRNDAHVEAISKHQEDVDKQTEEQTTLLESIDTHIKKMVDKSGETSGSPLTSFIETITSFFKTIIGSITSALGSLGRLALGALSTPLGGAAAVVGATAAVGYEMYKVNKRYSENMEGQSDEYKLNKASPTDVDNRSAAVKAMTKNSAETQAKWLSMSKEERVAQMANVEPVPTRSNQTEAVESTTAKVEDKKERKFVERAATQINNAPQQNITVAGGASKLPHFKQSPRNPDTSFVKWRDSRTAYI